MAYFPLFVDLKDRICIVIGGGTVAARKVKVLLEFEAKVVVIAPEICASIKECSCVSIEKEYYNVSQITEGFLVIAATDNQMVNERIAQDCKTLDIWVNVVDNKDLCTFVFPASIKKGDLVVGVTTSGKNPSVSKILQHKIEEIIPGRLIEELEAISVYREELKSKEISEDEKKKALEEKILKLFG